ncbi:MAG: hypothetical protein JSW73_05095 [Candidatus Woesearchaeota archaeon]|nr:MAG: hypothetical protein JSW73_05095 [Candidatus Woesearchaeota archaeon]
MVSKLRVSDDKKIREFLLTPKGLSKEENRGLIKKHNAYWFVNDLFDKKLVGYEGTFVAYQKGILCGQSEDGKLLYKEAKFFYDDNPNISVFKVPKDGKTLDELFDDDGMFGVSDDEREIIRMMSY